jgi:hypothetical protein
MYRKRNRINERLEQDKKTGLEDVTRSLFITSTIRDTACSEEDAFRIIKRCWAYAVAAIRRPAAGLRGSPAWAGLELEHIGDVDIQPQTKKAHIHAMTRLRALPGQVLPTDRAIGRRLGYYFNRALSRELGLEVLAWEKHKTTAGAVHWSNPYRGKQSSGYVHVGAAANNQAVVQYMALHNGKIWTDGRQYPYKFRRFSTSLGFLAREYETEVVAVRQRPPAQLVPTLAGTGLWRPPVREWPIKQVRRRVPSGSGWSFVKGRNLDDVLGRVRAYNEACEGPNAVQWERDDPFGAVNMQLLDKRAGLPSLVALDAPIDDAQVLYWLWDITPLEVNEDGLTLCEALAEKKGGIDAIAVEGPGPGAARGDERRPGTGPPKGGGDNYGEGKQEGTSRMCFMHADADPATG